eukprot:Trichotokara_eunicae@DN3910_c0_g1_i1.p1
MEGNPNRVGQTSVDSVPSLTGEGKIPLWGGCIGQQLCDASQLEDNTNTFLHSIEGSTYQGDTFISTIGLAESSPPQHLHRIRDGSKDSLATPVQQDRALGSGSPLSHANEGRSKHTFFLDIWV